MRLPGPAVHTGSGSRYCPKPTNTDCVFGVTVIVVVFDAFDAFDAFDTFDTTV